MDNIQVGEEKGEKKIRKFASAKRSPSIGNLKKLLRTTNY